MYVSGKQTAHTKSGVAVSHRPAPGEDRPHVWAERKDTFMLFPCHWTPSLTSEIPRKHWLEAEFFIYKRKRAFGALKKSQLLWAGRPWHTEGTVMAPSNQTVTTQSTGSTKEFVWHHVPLPNQGVLSYSGMIRKTFSPLFCNNICTHLILIKQQDLFQLS